MRIKSKWSKKDKTHSVEEIGGALAFIAFRLAQNTVLNLERNDFQTETLKQRVDIISEFLCFIIHLMDRMTIDRFTENERVRFVSELAVKSAKNFEDNMRDIVGPGEYRQDFIDKLNERMNDYAEFHYDTGGDGASFPMRRFFGDLVTKQMSGKNKRWVTDQVIDVEAPEMQQALDKSVPNLFK